MLNRGPTESSKSQGRNALDPKGRAHGILLLGPFPPYQGGIAIHTDRVREALVARGIVVTTANWRIQFPPKLYKGSVRRLNRSAIGEHDGMVWWNPVSWLRARRLAAKHSVTVFPYVSPFHAVQHIVVSGGSARRIALLHNVSPHEPMPGKRMVTRWALNRCTAVVMHGESVQAALRELGVRTPGHVVPMPSLQDVEPARMELADPPLLLMFGHVRQYKGVDLAIEALSLVADRSVRLVIAGRFWIEPSRLVELAGRKGLSDRVEFQNRYLADDELALMLSQSRLVLAPYTADTLSAVIPTALAAGRPVVATAVEGVRRQVRHEENGIIVPPNDPVGLARGIERALEMLPQLMHGALERNPSWADVALTVVRAAGLDTIPMEGAPE